MEYFYKFIIFNYMDITDKQKIKYIYHVKNIYIYKDI